MTTFNPAVYVKYAWRLSEWCSTAPMAPPYGMRTTIGRRIRPRERDRVFREVRDDLLEGRVGEAVELHLETGAHAVHRHADGGTDDPRLRERRIETRSSPNSLLQPIGDAENAAELPDILAEDQHVWSSRMV